MAPYILGFLITIGLSFVSSSEGKLWALLVAGSSGYENYRHQADVSHAYQILRHHNLPEENIITMMYDDIAENPANPRKGVIINQPGGKNVYPGKDKIDYSGETVNPKNFINVLSGNKKAMKGIGTGRVIESGPDDTVFVNFADHGGPGILCFPSEDLSVKDLNNTLVSLSQQKKFKKLILYVEACNAGSMFDEILPDDADIFVMTAADPNESSYACYYDEGTGTYLGDCFSVHWMQESEKFTPNDLTNKSLHHIFEIVRSKTEDKSHVEEYGDLDIGVTKLAEIIIPVILTESVEGTSEAFESVEPFDTYREDVGEDAVEAFDVPLEILYKKLRKVNQNGASAEAKLLKSQIRTIMKNRFYVENIVDELIIRMARQKDVISTQLRNKRVSINKKNIDCYDAVLKEFSNKCFKIAKNPFVATQLHVLVNACDLFNYKESKIIRYIRHTCQNVQPMTNIV